MKEKSIEVHWVLRHDFWFRNSLLWNMLDIHKVLFKDFYYEFTISLPSLRHLVLTTSGEKISDDSGFWSNSTTFLCSYINSYLCKSHFHPWNSQKQSSLLLLESCSSFYDFCHEHYIPFLLQAIDFYRTRKETVPSSKRQYIQVVKSKSIG